MMGKTAIKCISTRYLSEVSLYERNGDYMKKKVFIICLLIVATFLLGAAPVKADSTAVPIGPVRFSDEQVKLAQLNWNAYLNAVKANPANPASAYIGPFKSVYPDSVIGKAAIVHHFSPYVPAVGYITPDSATPTNNPYFNYYQYYYCTYQY